MVPTRLHYSICPAIGSYPTSMIRNFKLMLTEKENSDSYKGIMTVSPKSTRVGRMQLVLRMMKFTVYSLKLRTPVGVMQYLKKHHWFVYRA